MREREADRQRERERASAFHSDIPFVLSCRWKKSFLNWKTFLPLNWRSRRVNPIVCLKLFIVVEDLTLSSPNVKKRRAVQRHGQKDRQLWFCLSKREGAGRRKAGLVLVLVLPASWFHGTVEQTWCSSLLKPVTRARHLIHFS